MLMPGRSEENERFIREWKANLERRWAERPPMVRSATHYLRRAPFDPGAAIALLVALVILILVITFLTIFAPPIVDVLSWPR